MMRVLVSIQVVAKVHHRPQLRYVLKRSFVEENFAPERNADLTLASNSIPSGLFEPYLKCIKKTSLSFNKYYTFRLETQI